MLFCSIISMKKHKKEQKEECIKRGDPIRASRRNSIKLELLNAKQNVICMGYGKKSSKIDQPVQKLCQFKERKSMYLK